MLYTSYLIEFFEGHKALHKHFKLTSSDNESRQNNERPLNNLQFAYSYIDSYSILSIYFEVLVCMYKLLAYYYELIADKLNVINQQEANKN